VGFVRNIHILKKRRNRFGIDSLLGDLVELPVYSLDELITYCEVAKHYAITGYETNKKHWHHLSKVLKHMRKEGFVFKKDIL
jgi:hypothetical protein